MEKNKNSKRRTQRDFVPVTYKFIIDLPAIEKQIEIKRISVWT